MSILNIYGNMNQESLKYIFDQFQHESQFESFSELASGHINDTYLIKTEDKPYYVLQRINHGVFPDVPGLINNKVSVSNHLKMKLSHLPKGEQERRVLSFISTVEGQSFYEDKSTGYWNLTQFIDDSVTFERVVDDEIAYEGGKLFGEFLNQTSDFKVDDLIEVIPNFHDMSFRYKQFDEALKGASQQRKEEAISCIELVESSREEMHILQTLKESGAVPTRVTHNDTKISNALFDTNNKGLCVIDTDTVMPGIIHYDFGDAIRTICNTAAEDEQDLDQVNFNIDYYKSYVKGFLETVGESLTSTELEYLPLGAKSIIFIMGLRFLTDFLNNDIYYKAAYSHHNLDRAKNQFKLLESYSKQYEEVKQITKLA
ncbi:phosphotransferase enzyme family protein [Aestuariibaculum lutulentum]|uniref:Aminoglycoside phosphotransferase family protein n=1 Tax=Aestuariibaculum lutulentum TaxID=2920935 RepID=A0ABS9REK8_9FLAO|nr:aminoglycoside phosphotransferase family protein [Aestuariibaculum lutulentum]MCH4551388.1 aminoglycoside phosphotransferase family protein [Aestuariibaculum lutulentum]